MLHTRHQWNSFHTARRQHKQRWLGKIAISDVSLHEAYGVPWVDVATPTAIVHSSLKLFREVSGRHHFIGKQ
jgi:hypothetical protein